MDETLRADLARVMGMKASEVIGYLKLDDGFVVTTHDGTRSLVTDDGIQPFEGELPNEDLEGEPEREAPPSGPPDGTAKEVLAWVDGDPERAVEALVVEEAKETPRKGLVADLQQIVAA